MEQRKSAGFVLVGGESRRMPRDKALLMSMAESSEAQLIVPVSERGYELAAGFRRDCLPQVDQAISGEDRRLSSLYSRLRRREISPAEWRRFDPDGVLFVNVNTPADLERAVSSLKV